MQYTRTRTLTPTDTVGVLNWMFLKGKPFYYIRFGDTEVMMMRDPTFNKNKRHKPCKELSDEIRHSFYVEDENYLVALAKGTPAYQHLTSKVRRTRPVYLHASAVHSRFVKEPKEMTRMFVQWTYGFKKVLLIGGATIANHRRVRTMLNVSEVVTLPDINAYYALGEKKMDEIWKGLEGADLVIPALGAGGKALIWRLWASGYRGTVFDVGSVVDAFAGKATRTWIRDRLRKGWWKTVDANAAVKIAATRKAQA